MRTDARVRYTKKIIKESFFELLKKNPVNQITVKSICELSELNRTTFYKYYTDPYDLLKQIENEFILEMQKLIEYADNKNITQTLIIILTAIKQYGEWYTILISEHGDNTFLNRVLMDSYNIKKDSMNSLLPNMSQTYQEWLYYFITQGCTSVLVSWVTNGMKEEPLEVAQFLNRLSNIILKELQ